MQRLWATCDLAMSVLISKTTNYELKEFPAELQMSAMFYEKHEDPKFVNAASYLPPEMIPKAPKKAGLYMPMSAIAPAALKGKVRVFWKHILKSY